jgi:hypothetical protein
MAIEEVLQTVRSVKKSTKHLNEEEINDIDELEEVKMINIDLIVL